MSLILELRRRGRQVVGPTFGALIVGYFLFHAVQGERGIVAWAELRQEVVEAERTLERIGRTRQRMEHRVSLLRSDNLDRDLLDERVRLITGLAAPGDLIIHDKAPEWTVIQPTDSENYVPGP